MSGPGPAADGVGGPVGPGERSSSAVAGLEEVMRRLRRDCPWDAEQTHRSLVRHLVEETCEVVEAIEDGTDTDLAEELGDLLFQVVFHSRLAAERDAFTLDDVASRVADKLVRRHPHVFADGTLPEDLTSTWEQRKRAEKGRTSALEGIPDQLSALSRAQKVIGRARSHGVPLPLPAEPITEHELGERLLALAARAQAAGLDAEQLLRDRLRTAESAVQAEESAADARLELGTRT